MNSFYSEKRWTTWIDHLSEKDYIVIDNFLPRTAYDEIKKYLAVQPFLYTKAGIGSIKQKRIDDNIRSDFTHWLKRDTDTELSSFWELIDELMSNLNKFCYLNLKDFEFHLAKYPPGSFYAKHIDQFQNDNSRVISVVIYLNENWKESSGGELEIYNKDETTKLIAPLARRCVIFKSGLVPHKVVLTHENRYSLTGWLLDKPASLGKYL